MTFGDKLVRNYFFRVSPGREAALAEELTERLRAQREPAKSAERWAHYSWLGRFDFLAVSETARLFGQDAFLFTPEAIPHVYDVAELVAFQVELRKGPTLGEVLVPRRPAAVGRGHSWVALTLFKLDHERLLDNATVAAFRRGTRRQRRGADILPYGWGTQVAAIAALRRLASKSGNELQVGIGGGLGDSEIVVASRFASFAALFRYLEACGGLRVCDLVPEWDARTEEMRAPLFLYTFTQVGIDYRVVAPGFAEGRYEDIHFTGEEEEVQAVLQCAGPRSRTVAGLHRAFVGTGWEHYQLLGAVDDAFLPPGTMSVGDLVRKWVRVRCAIGRRGRSSNRDRTELGVAHLSGNSEAPVSAPRPVRVRPLHLRRATVKRFLEWLEKAPAPQELRAVEHILERAAALSQSAGTTLALVDFRAYFEAIHNTMTEILKAEEDVERLRALASEMASVGEKEVAHGATTRSEVLESLRRVDKLAGGLRDKQAEELRKVTDTARLFDAALAQRVGAETEDLLTAGFSNRAVSHIGSLSRLIMAGSYLAHAVYEHTNAALAAQGFQEVPYEGFIVYSRDNEAWAFSRHIAQLPDAALWHPEDADILLHEIGHHLADKITRGHEPLLDQALLRTCREAREEGETPPAMRYRVFLSTRYRDLSNLWADLFWCAMSESASAEGASEFVLQRLAWLERRQVRYTEGDLRRLIGRAYAVVTCCGVLDAPRSARSFAELRSAQSSQDALEVVRGASQQWLRSDGVRSAWMRKAVEHLLRRPEEALESEERYRHGLLLGSALRRTPELLAVLGRKRPGRLRSHGSPGDRWLRVRQQLERGRVPGKSAGPTNSKMIPQLLLQQLSNKGALTSMRTRLAVCVWLYNQYCREVLHPVWEESVSRKAGARWRAR